MARGLSAMKDSRVLASKTLVALPAVRANATGVRAALRADCPFGPPEDSNCDCVLRAH